MAEEAEGAPRRLGPTCEASVYMYSVINKVNPVHHGSLLVLSGVRMYGMSSPYVLALSLSLSLSLSFSPCFLAQGVAVQVENGTGRRFAFHACQFASVIHFTPGAQKVPACAQPGVWQPSSRWLQNWPFFELPHLPAHVLPLHLLDASSSAKTFVRQRHLKAARVRVQPGHGSCPAVEPSISLQARQDY